MNEKQFIFLRNKKKIIVSTCNTHVSEWQTCTLFKRCMLRLPTSKHHLLRLHWKHHNFLFPLIKCMRITAQRFYFDGLCFFPFFFSLFSSRISSQPFKNLNVSCQFEFVSIMVLIIFIAIYLTFNAFWSWFFKKCYPSPFYFHLVFVFNWFFFHLHPLTLDYSALNFVVFLAFPFGLWSHIQSYELSQVNLGWFLFFFQCFCNWFFSVVFHHLVVLRADLHCFI